MSTLRRIGPSIAGLILLFEPSWLNAAGQSGSFEFTTTFDNKLITLHLDDDLQLNPAGKVAEGSDRKKSGSFAFAGTLVGEMTIVRSTGGPFEVGEVAPFDCVASGINVPGLVEVEAYCVTNHGSGNKWYRKSSRTDEDYDAGTGRMQLFGGTGVFANLDGNCTYEVIYSAPWSKGEVLAKCEWQIMDRPSLAK